MRTGMGLAGLFDNPLQMMVTLQIFPRWMEFGICDFILEGGKWFKGQGSFDFLLRKKELLQF